MFLPATLFLARIILLYIVVQKQNGVFKKGPPANPGYIHDLQSRLDGHAQECKEVQLAQHQTTVELDQKRELLAATEVSLRATEDRLRQERHALEKDKESWPGLVKSRTSNL